MSLRGRSLLSFCLNLKLPEKNMIYVLLNSSHRGKEFPSNTGCCSVAFAHCCETFNKYFPYKNTCCDFQSYLTIVQIVSAPFLSIEPLFSQKNDNQQRMMFGGLAKPLLLTSKCSPLNIAHINSFSAGLNFLKKSNQLNNGKIRVQKIYKNEH